METKQFLVEVHLAVSGIADPFICKCRVACENLHRAIEGGVSWAKQQACMVLNDPSGATLPVEKVVAEILPPLIRMEE